MPYSNEFEGGTVIDKGRIMITKKGSEPLRKEEWWSLILSYVGDGDKKTSPKTERIPSLDTIIDKLGEAEGIQRRKKSALGFPVAI